MIKRDVASLNGASLQHCEFAESRGVEYCNIFAAYASVCPLKDALNNLKFLYSERSIRNFINQSLTSSLRGEELFRNIYLRRINHLQTRRSYPLQSRTLFCLGNLEENVTKV